MLMAPDMPPDTRLEDLTIRELMVELSRIEAATTHAGEGDRDAKAERRLARREQKIIAELHRRH